MEEQKRGQLTKRIKDKTFYEDGHALTWVEFKERGCPLTKAGAEEDYFLTEKEVLRIAKKIKK